MRINDDDGSGGGKSNQLFVWVCIALLLEENIKMVQASPRQRTISSSPWTTFSAFLSNFTQFVTVLYSFLHILYWKSYFKDGGVLPFFCQKIWRCSNHISLFWSAQWEAAPHGPCFVQICNKAFVIFVIIIPNSFLTAWNIFIHVLNQKSKGDCEESMMIITA